MAKVKGKIQYPKKVDFRLEDELFMKLEYIMSITGAKRGSWCRQAVLQRVENFERDNPQITTEEDYERFKQTKKA